MELRHLRHFLAVAETLNYTRAARLLNISGSPLSRSIQQLELDIGAPLFVRGTRKVELTPLGVALIPHATRIITNFDDLERDMRRRVHGHVELYVGMRSVPPELIRAVIDDVIRQAEPGADVRLEPLDSFLQMDHILSGKLSLGLVNRRSEDNRLEYLAVLHEAPGIALPDEPRYRELTDVHPADLAGLRLLLQPGSDRNAPELQPFVREVLETIDVSSDIVGGIAAMVAAGGSCCVTVANPSAPWHRYLAAEGVVIRPLALDSVRAVTYLCWRTDRDSAQDLGPILSIARDRFLAPIEL
ncbi:LysR family transcriptional regulator [Frondihabitans cladoniiphilus]|uniref:LysR family transcriptional regulator n=1 Tax=Frondihabitans cladoniiphilus TaxID=715785 RepID=A0ABP8VQ53_9MICO